MVYAKWLACSASSLCVFICQSTAWPINACTSFDIHNPRLIVFLVRAFLYFPPSASKHQTEFSHFTTFRSSVHQVAHLLYACHVGTESYHSIKHRRYLALWLTVFLMFPHPLHFVTWHQNFYITPRHVDTVQQCHASRHFIPIVRSIWYKLDRSLPNRS